MLCEKRCVRKGEFRRKIGFVIFLMLPIYYRKTKIIIPVFQILHLKENIWTLPPSQSKSPSKYFKLGP